MGPSRYPHSSPLPCAHSQPQTVTVFRLHWKEPTGGPWSRDVTNCSGNGFSIHVNSNLRPQNVKINLCFRLSESKTTMLACLFNPYLTDKDFVSSGRHWIRLGLVQGDTQPKTQPAGRKGVGLRLVRASLVRHGNHSLPIGIKMRTTELGRNRRPAVDRGVLWLS